MMSLRSMLTGLALLAFMTLAFTFHAVARGERGGPAGAVVPLRGGKLYDKWWEIIGVEPPLGEHPLYPPRGQQTGSTTYRCKECHGWDYKGADGAYGKGSSHYTGIPGVFGSTMTPEEMFDLIKFDFAPNGHGYGDYGLTDEDIDDLVEFLQTLVIDTDDYVDEDAAFIGDEVQGLFNYTLGGQLPCITCHGPYGAWLNFGTEDDPEWIGTVAVENPWELMHKIRFGHPGCPVMPSWLEGGGDDQGVADIGTYAQLNFPTGPCPPDITGDGVAGSADLIQLLGAWGPCADCDDCPADLDGNCSVGAADLLILLVNWGPCP